MWETMENRLLCVYLLWISLFKSCPLKKKSDGFPFCWVLRIIHILGASPLSDTWFASVFSQSVVCIFIFLSVSFAEQKFLVLLTSSGCWFQPYFCEVWFPCPFIFQRLHSAISTCFLVRASLKPVQWSLLVWVLVFGPEEHQTFACMHGLGCSQLAFLNSPQWFLLYFLSSLGVYLFSSGLKAVEVVTLLCLVLPSLSGRLERGKNEDFPLNRG